MYIDEALYVHVHVQGVRSAGGVGQDVHNKSQLDNIVGSLWQARQESSGSSLGNQVNIYTSPQYISQFIIQSKKQINILIHDVSWTN